MKRFALFFALQFVSYGLLCWNFRAVARGMIGNAVLSDLLIAWAGWTIISRVAEAKGDPVAKCGYVAGGACGSAVSIVLTKYFWGS